MERKWSDWTTTKLIIKQKNADKLIYNFIKVCKSPFCVPKTTLGTNSHFKTTNATFAIRYASGQQSVWELAAEYFAWNASHSQGWPMINVQWDVPRLFKSKYFPNWTSNSTALMELNSVPCLYVRCNSSMNTIKNVNTFQKNKSVQNCWKNNFVV